MVIGQKSYAITNLERIAFLLVSHRESLRSINPKRGSGRVVDNSSLCLLFVRLI
jgi:hypothetical protein